MTGPKTGAGSWSLRLIQEVDRPWGAGQIYVNLALARARLAGGPREGESGGLIDGRVGTLVLRLILYLISDMIPIMATAKEQRIRRKARRLGYCISKSRAMISLDNLGGYMLIDADSNFVVSGARHDLTLDDLDEMLSQSEDDIRVDV